MSRSKRLLHVAVGVIEQQGLYLIAKRPDNKPMGGLWEFPGGKVNPGEAIFDALKRELQEELAIEVTEAAHMTELRHPYEYGTLVLNVWRVAGFLGELRGAEGQEIRWVPKIELNNYSFPSANGQIVALL